MSFEKINHDPENKKDFNKDLSEIFDVVLRRYDHLIKVRAELGAVKKIGSLEDRNRLISILENPKEHSREELIYAMMENYSGKDYGDTHNNKVYQQWGGPDDGKEFITEYGQFRNQYPHLKQLTLDPGFMNHLTDFMELAKEQDFTLTSPLEARRILREALGTQEVYRGMTLTEAQMEEMKHSGIIASIPREMENSSHPIDKEFEVHALSIKPKDMNYHHFNAGASLSTMISVSQREKVASSAGKDFGRYDEENKKNYLMKLDIPIIDLMYWENDTSVPVTREVESFVFWKINPEEIIQIEEVIEK